MTHCELFPNFKALIAAAYDFIRPLQPMSVTNPLDHRFGPRRNYVNVLRGCANRGVCQHVSGHESLDYLGRYCVFENSTPLPTFTYWRKLLVHLQDRFWAMSCSATR